MAERKDDVKRCDRCGQPKDEHKHGGAAYGYCGRFIEPKETGFFGDYGRPSKGERGNA